MSDRRALSAATGRRPRVNTDRTFTTSPLTRATTLSRRRCETSDRKCTHSWLRPRSRPWIVPHVQAGWPLGAHLQGPGRRPSDHALPPPSWVSSDDASRPHSHSKYQPLLHPDSIGELHSASARHSGTHADVVGSSVDRRRCWLSDSSRHVAADRPAFPRAQRPDVGVGLGASRGMGGERRSWNN
jgi:hypothetical protein